MGERKTLLPEGAESGGIGGLLPVCVRESIPMLLVFVTLALFQGAYYIHYIGALTLPDGAMHALGSYALATGQSLNPVEEWTDDWGNVRKSQILMGYSGYLALEGARNDLVSNIVQQYYPTDPSREAQVAAASFEGEEMRLPYRDGDAYHYSRANQYFPIAWLPQAVGMRIGMTFGMSPYSVWQMGRCANLACFIVAFSAAVALLPRMKWFLVLVGVIPTTVFAASSLMCDATLVSLCSLSVALTLRVIDSGRAASRAQTVLFGLIGAVVILVKVTYAPVCFGFLLLPRKTLDARGKFLACVPLALAVFFYLAFSLTIGDMAFEANKASNIAAMLASPGSVLVRIAYQIINLPGYLFLSAPMYRVIAALAVGYLVAFVMSHGVAPMPRGAAEFVSRNRFVLGALLAAFVSVFGILLFLLLSWNDLSSQALVSSIEGFQGRYLLPVYPVICYLATIVNACRQGGASAGIAGSGCGEGLSPEDA